jgi:hypothetical protein
MKKLRSEEERIDLLKKDKEKSRRIPTGKSYIERIPYLNPTQVSE